MTVLLTLPVAIMLVTAALIAGVYFRIQWCRNVFRAWDYLGGDGKHSISAYCGAGTAWYYVAARKAIDRVFGEGHCAKAAKDEGLG